MKKPYLLFSYLHYAPNGGTHDTYGPYATVEEAVVFGKQNWDDDRIEVLDLRTLKVVLRLYMPSNHRPNRWYTWHREIHS